MVLQWNTVKQWEEQTMHINMHKYYRIMWTEEASYKTVHTGKFKKS